MSVETWIQSTNLKVPINLRQWISEFRYNDFLLYKYLRESVFDTWLLRKHVRSFENSLRGNFRVTLISSFILCMKNLPVKNFSNHFKLAKNFSYNFHSKMALCTIPPPPLSPSTWRFSYKEFSLHSNRSLIRRNIRRCVQFCRDGACAKNAAWWLVGLMGMMSHNGTVVLESGLTREWW